MDANGTTRPSARAGAAAKFADLRGVTVRNTFLEFEDFVHDCLPDQGFARQASEPASLLIRQVSKQTTAGSSGTYDETSPEEEACRPARQGGAVALRAPVAATTHALPDQAGGHDFRMQHAAPGAADVSAAQGGNLGGQCSACAPQEAAQPMQQAQILAIRFCPNCGEEVEPTHRFCPFCCYQLHRIQDSVLAPALAPATPWPETSAAGGRAAAVLGQGDAENRQRAPAKHQDMLGYIRRFRYIEASETDVYEARMLCEKFMRSGQLK